MEEIFSNPNLDINKRTFQDSFLNQIYNCEENDELFKKYEQLLCTIFTFKGMNKNMTYIELEKTVLMQVLREAKIIENYTAKKTEEKK